MKRRPLTLTLDGLTIAPAQVWGNVRLIPLLRDTPLLDLRLGLRGYGTANKVVQLDPKLYYTSYIPHGLVVNWSPDGEPIAAVDTVIGSRDKAKKGLLTLERMVRREGQHGLRMLPLDVAMEGFLAMHFGGPDFAVRFWSNRALVHGMDPRTEQSVLGASIPGLDEALSLFERHVGQCGMLVFIGDQLASATVVGHPDDYRALHDALVTDLYGMLFAQWGWAFREVSPFAVELEGTDLPAIRASLIQARDDWAAFAQRMASGLFPRDIEAEHVRHAGPYELVRFATGFSIEAAVRDGEHLGEALVRDGRIAYLKTYRLDRGQIRRGYVLQQFARHAWDPQALADAQGHGELQRVREDLNAAGLGWMMRPPS